MKRIKCYVAFGVCLSMVGGIVYVVVKAPLTLTILILPFLAYWAITTTLDCLTSEGD